MYCLKDISCGKYTLVGIRDFVHCAHPENLLYINDIRGITLRSAAAIANEEQRTGFNLLNQKIILAHQKVFNKLTTLMAGSFDFNAYIEAREIDEFDTTTHPPVAEERGLVLKRWRSEMARIFVEELYIKVKESGIAIVKIEDGETTKYFQVSLIGNKTNVVKIQYRCESEEVRITFDQTNFTTYGFELEEDTGCYSCGTHRRKHRNLEVYGWDGHEEKNEGYGMGILANVQCYEEHVFCQLLPRMNFMILYQAAIEVLNEALASTRVNAVVVFNKEQAVKTIEDLKNDLRSEEKTFRNSVTNFLKTTRGECFSCNGGGIRDTYGIPG